MFSGIIEEKGRITAIDHQQETITFTIEASSIPLEMKVNDSLAIDGVCLTVVSRDTNLLSFNLVPQTLEKTTLGSRYIGEEVNLERAMGINSRFDGHLVQGHVDCKATIVSVDDLGTSVEISIEIPSSYANLIVPRGSITIDGISFTIAKCQEAQFTIAVIPHTLSLTTIGSRSVGNEVNIEFDILGKYVLKSLDNWRKDDLE